MLSPQRASQISTRRYSTAQYPQVSPEGIFVDSDVVLPNRHWIILSATLRITSPVIGALSEATRFGGQYTGIFMCPPGAKKPNVVGGMASLMFKAGEANPYAYNQALNSFWEAGPPNSMLPVTKSDDNTGNGLSGDTCVLFYNQPFYVGSNWFIRGMFPSPGTLENAANLTIEMALQLIEENDC